MKLTVSTLALLATFALTAPAFAGDYDNCVNCGNPPPPSPSLPAINISLAGDAIEQGSIFSQSSLPDSADYVNVGETAGLTNIVLNARIAGDGCEPDCSTIGFEAIGQAQRTTLQMSQFTVTTPGEFSVLEGTTAQALVSLKVDRE